MENEIKVVLFGVGPLGVAIAKGMLEKKGMKIVGAVDTAKELVGKDLGEILKAGKTLGVTVTDDPQSLLSKAKPNVAIIATKSSVKGVYPELKMCIKCRSQRRIDLRRAILPISEGTPTVRRDR